MYASEERWWEGKWREGTWRQRDQRGLWGVRVGAPPGRGGTQAECTGCGGQGDPPTHRASSHGGPTLGPHTGSLSPEAPVPVQATEAKQRCVTSVGMAPSGQRARPRGKPCQPMASSPWKDRSRMEARQAWSRRGLEREAEENGAWRGPGPRGLQGHGPELKRNSLQLEGRGGLRRLSLGWSPKALQEPREEEASRECQTARERRQAGGGMGRRHDSGGLGGAGPARRDDKCSCPADRALKTMSGSGVETRFWWAEGGKGR